MFHPIRFGDWVVYDVRQLIAPRTQFEENAYVRATRLVPTGFGGRLWGEELEPGSVWINAEHHDLEYKRIRSGLRTDPAFLARCSGQMVQDIDALEQRVRWLARGGARSASEVAVLAAALRWFATNWLHPLAAVKSAIARLCPHCAPGEVLSAVLAARHTTQLAPFATTPSTRAAHIQQRDALLAAARQEGETSFALLEEQITFMDTAVSCEERRRIAQDALVAGHLRSVS